MIHKRSTALERSVSSDILEKPEEKRGAPGLKASGLYTISQRLLLTEVFGKEDIRTCFLIFREIEMNHVSHALIKSPCNVKMCGLMQLVY